MLEGLLWKISSIGIMGTIPFESLLIVLLTLDEVPADYTLWPMSGFYALCRIYIVLEAFLSLRHVPLGVYAAIPWAQSIPHL